MNSEKRETKRVKGYPKLMVAIQGVGKGSIILATSRQNDTTFKGIVLHISGKPGWEIGTQEFFDTSYFTDYEGELILSN